MSKTAKIDKRFSRWVRLYTEALHDPKILSLSYKDRWAWIGILMTAGKHETGALPTIPYLAVELRMSNEDTQRIFDHFVDIGLIDLCGGLPGYPNAYRPHNWGMRQYRGLSSTERSRKRRAKMKIEARNGYATECNVACNGSAPDLSESVSSFFNTSGEKKWPAKGRKSSTEGSQS
jgi:hypothetical protein